MCGWSVRRYWCEKNKERQEFELGDDQGTPSKYSRTLKRLSLGMPRKASHLYSTIIGMSWFLFCSHDMCKFLECVLWPISFMLGGLFSRWVFIHLSLHERVEGNRDAQSHNESKIIITKFLGKCWYGRHPWIRLAMDCERMVERKWTLFSVWEPPIMCLAWKILGTFGRSVDRNSMPLKIISSL